MKKLTQMVTFVNDAQFFGQRWDSMGADRAEGMGVQIEILERGVRFIRSRNGRTERATVPWANIRVHVEVETDVTPTPPAPNVKPAR